MRARSILAAAFRALVSPRIGRTAYLVLATANGVLFGFVLLWLVRSFCDMDRMVRDGAGPAMALEYMAPKGLMLISLACATMSTVGLLLSIWRGRDIGLRPALFAGLVLFPWVLALVMPSRLAGVVTAVAIAQMIYLGLARGRPAHPPRIFTAPRAAP